MIVLVEDPLSEIITGWVGFLWTTPGVHSADLQMDGRRQTLSEESVDGAVLTTRPEVPG
eukprot:COSAG02_NODE_43_length_45989_cov_93.430181_19_plen_59_part_00